MGTGNRRQDCRRRDPRKPVECKAQAFGPDGRRVDVTVSNISLGGIGFAGGTFAADERFRLVLPNRGETDARVSWTSAGGVGAQFSEAGLLGDWVPQRERNVLRRSRGFSFASGRTFGRRGLP